MNRPLIGVSFVGSGVDYHGVRRRSDMSATLADIITRGAPVMNSLYGILSFYLRWLEVFRSDALLCYPMFHDDFHLDSDSS